MVGTVVSGILFPEQKIGMKTARLKAVLQTGEVADITLFRFRTAWGFSKLIDFAPFLTKPRRWLVPIHGL
jgi:hypothetical protein